MRARLVMAGAFAALLACNQSGTETGGAPTTDAATTPPVDAGTDGVASPACYTNPQNYLEIINACTDAQAIDKTDDLSPMNLTDGGLQPLP